MGVFTRHLLNKPRHSGHCPEVHRKWPRMDWEVEH